MEPHLSRIALIQTCVGADIHQNISRIHELISAAHEQGATIICLPELFSTPYFPQYIGLDISAWCFPADGHIIHQFSEIAKKRQVVLIIPFCEKGSDGCVYNSAVVIDADGTPFRPYHKVHLPQDPYFYEKAYFCPGNEYAVYKTRYGSVAVLICYDQWFPEAARCVALMGADIIFYPTAIGHIRGEIPAEGNWMDAWQLIQRSHAIANSIPVAAVNRCGWEGEIFFFGGSFVCDAFGSLVSGAGEAEEIIYADLDLMAGPHIRDGWGFFRNRRTDTYRSVLVSPAQDSTSVHGLTPGNQGYHMPAEWEPHDAVWMAWPCNDLTFPHLDAVEETYIDILVAFHQSEPVNLLVRDPATREKIKGLLGKRGITSSSIRFHEFQYSDVWIRDYGPTFVVNRALKTISAVSWEFNAWGDKYDELIADGRVSRFIPSMLGIPHFDPGLILEGGSIDVNGRGSLLTTRQCLLNPNRNPLLSQVVIESYLSAYLCVNTIIWLEDGIAGDDTDGHIDDIARFVNPGTIVCALEDDPEDDNYRVLQENYALLNQASDQDGNPFTIIPLPMPHPVSDEDYRYPATYLNFFIGNSVVLVPVFDDPHDDQALAILQGLFPGRNVIGVRSRELVKGFGTIHCATQQQPRRDP